MLNGDFSAITSPACNGGRQITLKGGFVNNTIDPSKFSPVVAGLPAARAGVHRPVRQAASSASRTTARSTRALAKVDYTISQTQTMFARYFYAYYDNPATYDGKNVLTLSRTSQTNQAHSLVVGHNFILSSNVLNSFHATYNRTLNDRPVPAYFTPTELGSKVVSPMPGFIGVSVTGNGFSVGAGATNPGFFNSKTYPARRRPRPRPGRPPDLGRDELGLLEHRDGEQPADQRRSSRSTDRPPASSLADFMMGAVSGGFLQGNAVYDYDHHTYIGAYAQDDWRVRPNLTLNVGVRWEPFLPVQNSYGWVSHFDRARSMPARTAPCTRRRRPG